MKEKNKSQVKTEKNLIESIINQGFFEIILSGHETKKNGKKTTNLVLWADKESQDILRKLFQIIKSELEIIIHAMMGQSKFDSLSNILFQNFFNDYREEKDLEESIEAEINDLKKYTFQVPKRKYKSLEDKYDVLSFDEVIDLVKFFRERRIQILKLLLEDFRNDKEKYNNFMKK